MVCESCGPPQARPSPSPSDVIQRLRLAFRLLGRGQFLVFLGLTVRRVVVGLCDMLLAATMYLLFLRLRGTVPSQCFPWEPGAVIAASGIAIVLVPHRSYTGALPARVFRLEEGSLVAETSSSSHPLEPEYMRTME